MGSLEEQLDAWAKSYLDAERLPCLALAVTQGNEVRRLLVVGLLLLLSGGAWCCW
jgi:hypothetical protein